VIRHVLTTKAIILVLLAALQGLVLAAFPMLNYWRSDIETILSERLDANVTISEIGARASWTGPYLEALNLVIEKERGAVEIRRVQMLLDLPASIELFEPVIGQLILDEGEIVQRMAGDRGIPDPKTWSHLLDQLQQTVAPIGAFQLHNVDVLLGNVSLKRLSVEIDPEIGVLAQTRLVTEKTSVPLEIDWRYPTESRAFHDVRVQTRLQNVSALLPGFEESAIGVEASAWLAVADNSPVRGQIVAGGLSDDGQSLTGDFSAQVELADLSTISGVFESIQLGLPGVEVTGTGGGFQFDGTRLIAALPRVRADGQTLGEFLKPYNLGPKFDRLLSLNQPSLDARDVMIDWNLSQDPIILAAVDSFEIQAARSIPHVGPVHGSLYLMGTQGWFDFNADAATFALPEIFPSPWQDQALSGTLLFDRSDRGLMIRGKDLRVQSAVQDVQGSLFLDLPRESEQQVQLELTVDASTEALPGLLPLDLDPEVHDFLTRSVQRVQVKNGRISYSGPLGSNIDRTRRELSMNFPLAEYRFQPLTQWPAFIGTEGVVEFVSKRARIEFLNPDFGGLSVSRVVAQQTDNDARRIDVKGQLRGQASDALNILAQAEVKPKELGSDILMEGMLSGDVSLSIPIGDRPEGSVAIEATDLVVALAELSEPFTNISGRAEYRLNDGLYTEQLTGKLLGDPVEASVTVSDGQTDIVGRATLETSNILKLVPLGFDESQLLGSADWSVVGRGDDTGFVLSFETDGRGFESVLPYPLSKDANDIGRIAVNLTSTPEERTFNAKLFETTAIRGQLGTNPLVLEITTPEAGIIDWASLPTEGGANSNLSILLKTDRLLLGDTPVSVSETAIILKPNEFEVSFDGSEMAGRVTRIGEGPLSIDLERLVLPEGGEFLDPPEEDPLFDYDPGQLPSAKVQISRLMRGTTKYEDMRLVLVSGESRLDATTLEFDRDGQRFQGELAWVFRDGKAQSALLLRAQGAELGNILRVNEDEPLLEAKSGRFVSNLTWEGSPLGFSVLTSDGTVELSLEDGRFLDLGNSAEVLRLFGILNIETITRRLRLDFLDLVQPGVAFDEVIATSKVSNGLLRFDPELAMKGPSSSFRLTGTADLVNQQLNQTLEVDIPLTNNLPIASVLLGAPQVGGAIYLVEKALGTKIIKVGKTDYRIEGSFDEPQVSLIPPFSKKKDDVNANNPANGQ